jgi:VWFA-related protein
MNTIKIAIYLLCALSCLLSGQQQTSPNRRITLDVQVTNKSGQLFPNLQQADFTLLDNKQPQPITSFRAVQSAAADPPVEILFVIDQVNGGYQIVTVEGAQLQLFLKQNGGNLPRPSSLVFFSEKGPTLGETFSRDGNALAADIDKEGHGLRSERRSQGAYGAEERLQRSLNALTAITQHEAARPGRKLLIWISPGWALLSGPRVELTTKVEGEIFRSIVNMSAALRAARITLYNVDPVGVTGNGPMRNFYYRDFLKGVKQPSQVHIADVSLQVLATQSGGLVLNGSNDVASEIARSVEDAATFYELTFDGLPADGPDDYHSLEVKVAKPGLIARTRTGYYAQP